MKKGGKQVAMKHRLTTRRGVSNVLSFRGAVPDISEILDYLFLEGSQPAVEIIKHFGILNASALYTYLDSCVTRGLLYRTFSPVGVGYCAFASEVATPHDFVRNAFEKMGGTGPYLVYDISQTIGAPMPAVAAAMKACEQDSTVRKVRKQGWEYMAGGIGACS